MVIDGYIKLNLLHSYETRGASEEQLNPATTGVKGSTNVIHYTLDFCNC